jgi:hypothetical protein
MIQALYAHMNNKKKKKGKKKNRRNLSNNSRPAKEMFKNSNKRPNLRIMDIE